MFNLPHTPLVFIDLKSPTNWVTWVLTWRVLYPPNPLMGGLNNFRVIMQGENWHYTFVALSMITTEKLSMGLI